MLCRKDENGVDMGKYILEREFHAGSHKFEHILKEKRNTDVFI